MEFAGYESALIAGQNCDQADCLALQIELYRRVYQARTLIGRHSVDRKGFVTKSRMERKKIRVSGCLGNSKNCALWLSGSGGGFLPLSGTNKRDEANFSEPAPELEGVGQRCEVATLEGGFGYL